MTDQMNDREQSLKDLHDLILQGTRREGLEATVVELGVSIFQAEAVLQELLCRIVGTQRALVEKGILTYQEIDKAVNDALNEHAEVLAETVNELKQKTEEMNNV